MEQLRWSSYHSATHSILPTKMAAPRELRGRIFAAGIDKKGEPQPAVYAEGAAGIVHVEAHDPSQLNICRQKCTHRMPRSLKVLCSRGAGLYWGLYSH